MHTRRWLVIAFLCILALRFAFSLSSPHLDLDSYFHLKQAQAVADTGLPLYTDDLSYQGRQDTFMPLFYYIFAPFAFSITLLKLMMSIVSASLIFIIYALAHTITKDDFASLYAAIVGSTIPAYFSSTLYAFEPAQLFIPLLFLLIYLFNAHEPHAYAYLILLMAIIFITPLSLVIALAIILYLVLLYFERIRVRAREQEFALFTLFSTILCTFFVYQNALATHESAVLSGNIPTALATLTTLNSGVFVYSVGFIPFIAGLWIISTSLFGQKNRAIFSLVSLSVASVLLLFTRLIPAPIGFSIFGICMSILFAKAYQQAKTYFTTTRAATHWKLANALIIIMLVLTSGLSSIASATVEREHVLTAHEYDALQWMREHTPQDATILARPSDGHVITTVATRKNFMDERYYFVDPHQRYDDLRQMYYQGFEINALTLMTQHNITYIYYSRTDLYPARPAWASNEQCFPRVYSSDTVTIYQRNTACQVRTFDT